MLDADALNCVHLKRWQEVILQSRLTAGFSPELSRKFLRRAARLLSDDRALCWSDRGSLNEVIAKLATTASLVIWNSWDEVSAEAGAFLDECSAVLLRHAPELAEPIDFGFAYLFEDLARSPVEGPNPGVAVAIAKRLDSIEALSHDENVKSWVTHARQELARGAAA